MSRQRASARSRPPHRCHGRGLTRYPPCKRLWTVSVHRTFTVCSQTSKGRTTPTRLRRSAPQTAASRSAEAVRSAANRPPSHLVSSPPPPPDPARAVLRSLRDHPHHDTVGEVAAHTGGAASDVARALRELRDAHMVQEADGHWQLT